MGKTTHFQFRDTIATEILFGDAPQNENRDFTGIFPTLKNTSFLLFGHFLVGIGDPPTLWETFPYFPVFLELKDRIYLK